LYLVCKLSLVSLHIADTQKSDSRLFEPEGEFTFVILDIMDYESSRVN